MGRVAKGDRPMTNAERVAAYQRRQKAYTPLELEIRRLRKKDPAVPDVTYTEAEQAMILRLKESVERAESLARALNLSLKARLASEGAQGLTEILDVSFTRVQLPLY